MKMIETTAVIGDDRKLTVQLPLDTAPGRHQVVVVIDGPRSAAAQSWTIDDWPVHDGALTDPNFTMRRVDL
jgi:hypothetical protein